MPLEDTDRLLRACIDQLDSIRSVELPGVQRSFSDADQAGDDLIGRWSRFSRYGRLDSRYARANGVFFACLERPIELRQDVEVAIKAPYLTNLLGLRNRDLIQAGSIDLGGGFAVTYEPSRQEPGQGTDLPVLNHPTDACHGPATGGMLPGEFGLRPGVVMNSPLTAGELQLRPGVTFGLYPVEGSPGSLSVQLARGHGICPTGALAAEVERLIFVPVARAIGRAVPTAFSLTPFLPRLPDGLPTISLVGVTRNETLLNLHFLYGDRPRRPRARIARIAARDDWDYSVMIEPTPIWELIEQGLETYDFESDINDAIEPICGLDPIDVHITRQEAFGWTYQPADHSFNVNLDLDYDFVLTGYGVHGTMFGEINVRARKDLTQMEAELVFRSRERDTPEVHTGGPVMRPARRIAETISSNLFPRIGPGIGNQVIFNPGNILKVEPRFESDRLQLDVWSAL